jgi:D-alanyl-D-alanine carboxypeptidase
MTRLHSALAAAVVGVVVTTGAATVAAAAPDRPAPATAAAATCPPPAPTAEPVVPAREDVALADLDPKLLAAAVGAGTTGRLPDTEASGALAVVRGSAGSWHGTGGVRTKDGGTVPLDARFRVGSITKVFTAVVAMQLVAERRLALDRTVQSYLPGLLPADPPITVRQVLTYTSGLNGIGIEKKWAWFKDHRYDHFAPGSQLTFTVAFPPGTKQRYGNADYILAGLLIERITGRLWDTEVTERIIRPLRLTGTSIPIDDPRLPEPHVRGYENVDGSWQDITEANPSLQWSAASIVSTAEDLDRLIVALFSGRLVPPRQLAQMFEVPAVPVFDGNDLACDDVPADYGIGIGRYRIGKVLIWGKSGDRPGYNNGVGATRDLRRRLVFSVNTLTMGGSQPSRSNQIIVTAFRTR